MKLKTIIIGLGKIGMLYDFPSRNHFNNHCEAISSHSKFNLIAGVDTSKQRLGLFKSKYNLPIYRNIKDAYEKLNPDLIIISVPTHKSIKILNDIKKLKIKKKIILLEKPGSFNFQDLKKFAKFCKLRNIELFINYTRSFSLFLKNLKNLLKKKKFGKIKKIKIFYHKGIYNSCSHYLNFLLNFFKNEEFKILNVFKKKKLKRDYLINFDIKLNVPVYFRYTKKKDKEKIIILSEEKKLTYLTEESEIFLNEKSKKFIKNDFKNNLKNVLDTIVDYNRKKFKFDISKDLTTLKIITKTVNENKKIQRV